VVPQTTDISPATLKALGHPLRIQMLGVLRERPHTRSELARRLGVDAPQVAYHARKLETLALITGLPRADGSSDRIYQLVAFPQFTDEAWEQTPSVARHALAAAMLNQMHATAVAAIPHGGFDRGNMHITRTSATVDDETWDAMARELSETLARLDALCEQGRQRVKDGAEPVNATVQMLLYTTPGPQDGGGEDHHPAGDDTCNDNLERIYELWEELERTIIRDEGELAGAVPLIDELRVVLTAGVVARRDRRLARDPADVAG